MAQGRARGPEGAGSEGRRGRAPGARPRLRRRGQRPEEHTPLERCYGSGGPRYCGDACRKAHWLAGHRDECAAGVAFITCIV